MPQQVKLQQVKPPDFVTKCSKYALWILVPQTIILIIVLFFLAFAAFGETKTTENVVKVEAIISVMEPTTPMPSNTSSVQRQYIVRFTHQDKELRKVVSSKRVFSDNQKTTIYIINQNTDNVHLDEPSTSSGFKKLAQILFWIILIILILSWVVYYKYKTFTCVITVLNFVLILLYILKSFKAF